jgi:hypothetical protein
MWSSEYGPLSKARCMRLSLIGTAVVGCIIIIAAAIPTALAGFLDQKAADKAYKVEFKLPGERCSPAHQIHLSVSDGRPLPCVRVGSLPSSGNPTVKGFTEAQTDEVIKLAAALGSDGLSAGEQRRIQDRVDQLVTSVPSAERAQYQATIRLGGMWGSRIAWAAIGALVAAVLGLIGCYRLADL